MSDVNANIGVQIDTSSALAELKNLQRQLANFHASIAKTSAAATLAQKGLQTNLLNSINATGQFTATMGNVRSSTESFTHALESNKLSMREYFRYAGGASKTFGRLFKQEFDTIGKVAEERVKKMQTQYIKMGRDANGAIKAMAITPQTLNMNDYATKTALAAQKQALFNQLVKQGSTSLLNFGKNTQWAGRQLMVGFTIPLAYFGTTASKVFMDLEAQAIKFKRVYGDMFTTADETNKALADVQALAEGFTKYGVAVSKTMEMAASAAAMGKTGADLTAQVSEATRLAVLGGVEQEQALETTISLTNAFGIAAEDLAAKINFLNSVENQTVVSIEDLTIAIPKAGPVVQQLGGNVEDLAFFLTAMKEGGINASEGANALKSGLASLINPSTKASKMLAGLGVNIKGIVEANKGDIKATVIGFAQALDTLAPLDRSRAIEQLFGKFQFARLSTLFQNITKEGTQASKVLKMAGASVEELAILSERELKTVENAVGVQFKSAVEELKLAIAPIGKTFLQAVTPIVKVVGDLLDKFNNLGDGTKKFIVIASTLVGIIGPTLLMTFGLVANGVANIIKLFLALRGGFLRVGGNSKILAEQTSYLNAEQLESATIAASLNQAHTRLTQSFTAETSAVRALRAAYVEATLAAANFARANPGMMMPTRSARSPKKFATGTTGLPGPKGAGDIIPLLGAPGEAIIPAKVAQDDRFKPIIAAMVSGNLNGYDDGTNNLQKTKSNPKQVNSEIAFSHITGDSQGTAEKRTIQQLYDSGHFKGSDQKLLRSYIDAGMGHLSASAYTSLGFDIKKETNQKLASDTVLKSNYIEEIKRPGAINTNIQMLHKNGMPMDQAIKTAHRFRKEYIANLLLDTTPTNITDKTLSSVTKQILSSGSYPEIANLAELNVTQRPSSGDVRKFIKEKSSSATEYPFNIARKILKKQKVSFGKKLGPEFSKSNANITIFKDSSGKIIGVESRDPLTKELTHRGAVLPGQGLDMLRTKGGGRFGGYASLSSRVKQSSDLKSTLLPVQKKILKKDALLITEQRKKSKTELLMQEKNAKAGNDSEQIMKQIDKDTRKTTLGKQTPTNFGTQISPTTGYSFPVRGLGGVYQKPDGSKVFVKPVLDAKAALAEQRATIIARDVHGLDAPKQEIRTMIDPTDPTGKRKLIVLESAFDPKFDPNKMSNKFDKEQYIKQNVAAALRVDKDLGRGNLSGNILADVGPAGVFKTASGPRDFAFGVDKQGKRIVDLPSMKEQAIINLGIDTPLPGGGRKKFFAEETAKIVREMTSDEYHNAMKKEIQSAIPKLDAVIKSFGITNPKEKQIYQAMLDRLREGEKVNWREIHKLHSSILIQSDEVVEDKKGKTTKPKSTRKPPNVKSSTGSTKDNRMVPASLAPNIRQKPKGFVNSGLPGKFTLPGYSDAPTVTGATVGNISQSMRLKEAQILAARERISLNQAKKRLAVEAKLITSMEKSTVAQQTTKQKLTAFSNKAGLGIGAMSGLTIAASFAGGQIGEMAQKIMPFVFGLQGIVALLPMLANPWVAAIAAIAAVGGVMWKMARDVENARKEGVNLAKAMNMTSEKLQNLSKITGTVSATEEADRRRQGTLTGESAVQRKFGQNILGSDFGKSLLADIEKQASSGQGMQEIGKNISNSLAYAVVQGVITTDQAKSISSALGEELKSYEIPAIISGRLTTLLGPNGENLATDPLQVTLAIQKDSMQRQADFFKTALESSISERTVTNVGGMIAGGALATAGALVAGASAIATPFSGGVSLPGVAVGGTMMTAGIAGMTAAEMDANKRKEVNANLGAAALQLGLEQVGMNNGLVDSLNKQYDIKVKMAKTDAEIKGIEAERQAALDKLNAKNAEALNLLIAQKDAFGPEIFTKGINAAVDALYKEGPMKVFADEAKKALDGIGNADFKAMLQVQFASGALDPATIIKLAKNQNLESKFTILVEEQGSENANLVMQLLMKAGTNDTNLPIFMDIINKDPKNFNKNVKAISVLANMQQKYGITIDINDDGAAQIKEVVAITEKLAGIKGEELTKQGFLDLGITGDMTGPEFDALWKTLVGTSKTINKSVIVDFVAAGDVNVIDAYMADKGIKIPSYLSPEVIKGLKENLKAKAQAWAVGRQGKNAKNVNLDDTPDGTTKTRTATPFDGILQDLKRTRDASIDAMGGAKELMRILGGKKDLQLFNGIDQQLSKLGANSDFIDWVGGLDNAVKEGIITIKDGIVAYGKYGPAAKKAFDERQLGLFSSKSAIAIKELQGQRTGFVALKAAGVESADALEMVADATFMVSLAAQTNATEIKALVDEYKAMKKEMDLTSVATDPQQYFNDQMAIAERKLNYQEALARRTYEPQIEATEKLIKAQNSLIDQKQRLLETDEKYGSRQIDKINSEIEGLNRQLALGVEATLEKLSTESSQLSEDQATIAKTVDAINEKYDLQEEALSKISELNQDIIAQNKQQISLADALTQGDISAAAKAAEDIQAAYLDRAQKASSDAITAARESQIAGVTGSLTGKTSTQISERQYQIDRRTYSLGIERARIEALIAGKQEEIYQIDLLRKPILQEIVKAEDEIYKLTTATALGNTNSLGDLQKKLAAELTAIDNQRQKWSDAALAIEGANLNTTAFNGKLTAAETLVTSITKLWESLKSKDLKITIETIEKLIRQGSSFVKAGTVQTKDGPVDVDASGKAADGSTPVPVEKSSPTDVLPQFNFRLPSGGIKKLGQHIPMLAKGGMVPKYFAAGGYAMGTDTVPAMLTPGEFVINKNAVDSLGVKNLNKLNSGESLGSSVYNYSVGINVTNSNANADDIARAVMGQIKYIDSQRIRGQR